MNATVAHPLGPRDDRIGNGRWPARPKAENGAMAGHAWVVRARLRGASLLGCCLLLLAGCSSTGTVSAGTATVDVDGRPATLYTPPSRPAGQPAALVVVLHGYTSHAADAIDFFGLRALADQRGFAILAPQGTTDAEGKTFWNASASCCNFDGSTVDDSGYLSRLIAAAVERQGLDPARVYMVGHSNGGFMALTFACQHADQVAAIASLAGALDTDPQCAPSEPVSVLQVHGTADPTISYDGGTIAGKPYTSAVQTVGVWRQADHCSRGSRPGDRLDADADVPGSDLRQTTWAGCAAGAEVSLWTITDGTHVPTLTPAFSVALIDWLEAHKRSR